MAVNTITALTICIQEKLQMPTKFEKLLDYLINEETEKANALFHKIVVEKSRSIYENLLAQEANHEEDKMMDDDMYDETSRHSMEEEESVYELAGDEDEFGDAEGDPADEFVDSVIDKDAMDMDADASDDMDGMDGMGDMDGMDSMDDMGDTASKEEVMDIKDALEELRAEFEALLSKEDDADMEDEEEDMDMEDEEDDMDMEDEEDDMDMEDEEDMDMEDEEDMEEAFIREYREIVEKNPLKGSTKEQGVNSNSPINANPKNRPSGGNVSARNIAQGGVEGTVTTAKAKGEFVPKGTLNVGNTQTKGYNKSTKKPAGEPSGTNAKSVVPK